MSFHIGSNRDMNQNSLSVMPSHEYKKIFCAYHRTEFLTNFCIQKQCLMPMCPSCVAEHTEYHNKSQQRPNYINLQEALQQVKQRCYTMIINLQDYQRKNEDISTHIEDLPDYLHLQLSSVKDRIYEHIEQVFNQYQEQVLKDIEKKYEESRVFNKEEADDIRSSIIGCIDSLYDKIGTLKSDQCLAGLITYYGQDQKAYEEACEDIGEYLNRHQKVGKMNISLSKPALTQLLDGLCFKTLTPIMVVDQNTTYEPLQQKSLRRNIASTSRALLHKKDPIKNQGSYSHGNSQNKLGVNFNYRNN